MNLKHDCKTCSHINTCEIKEAVQACKEAYAIGLSKLAADLSATIDSDTSPDLKLIWLRAGVEVVMADSRVDGLIKMMQTFTKDKNTLGALQLAVLAIVSERIMIGALSTVKYLSGALAADNPAVPKDFKPFPVPVGPLH
jgi:hypothetical protein